MQRHSIAAFAGLALVAALATGSAGADDSKPDEGFAKRLFAGNLAQDKSYACFVRVYDPEHLARHPLQKVSAMKLLITAETAEDKPGRSYSFRMGVKFTKRPGNFDSSGECNQITAGVIAEDKAQLGCAVDCNGGGISVELTKENKTTLVRLDRIRIWRNNKPEEEGLDLSGGADDRIFRLDRAGLNQCKTLVTDRKELAAMRTLKK